MTMGWMMITMMIMMMITMLMMMMMMNDTCKVKTVADKRAPAKEVG